MFTDRSLSVYLNDAETPACSKGDTSSLPRPRFGDACRNSPASFCHFTQIETEVSLWITAPGRVKQVTVYALRMAIRVVTGDLPTELTKTLREAPYVAVDTETTGLNWREDSLELCQLFTETSGAVLVRRSEAKPPNLTAILEDPTVVKVFHHAPFDLRFLEHTWGARTAPVFCTKTASKLLDPDLPHAAHSLGALAARYFGIHLNKGSVRISDWAAHELSPEQLKYAADDVSSLLQLAALESERLRQQDLDVTFAAICAYLPVDAHLEVAGFPNPLVY